VLAWAAVLNAALLAAIGIPHVDREAIAFAVLMLVGVGFTRLSRRGIAGIALLLVLFLDEEFWMASAAVSNVQTQESLFAILQPLVLALASAAGIVAAAGSIIRRRVRVVLAVRPIAAVGAAVFVVALAAEVSLNPVQAGSSSGLAMTIHNTAYSSRSLTASTEQVSISITNQDLFWHTFTIDRLGVNVAVPVGGHRTISFTAPSGTYIFYCAIPGHRQAGMQGSLRVP
jgi:plastocyanin